MGTVPNRFPVFISEIRDALGGANDLGWYRGRQYWNPAGGINTISGNAAMSEFPGLSTERPGSITNGGITSQIGSSLQATFSGGFASMPVQGVGFGGISPGTLYGSLIRGIYAAEAVTHVYIDGSVPGDFWSQLHIHGQIIIRPDGASGAVFEPSLNMTHWWWNNNWVFMQGNYVFDMA